MPDERLEGGPVERVDRAAGTCREFGELAKIARVTLERMVGQTPFDTQVIEVRVDEIPAQNASLFS